MKLHYIINKKKEERVKFYRVYFSDSAVTTPNTLMKNQVENTPINTNNNTANISEYRRISSILARSYPLDLVLYLRYSGKIHFIRR